MFADSFLITRTWESTVLESKSIFQKVVHLFPKLLPDMDHWCQTTFLILILAQLMNLITTCRCGHDAVSAKIINGELVAADQFPWVVYVQVLDKKTKRFSYCTGSIIGPSHVLTAAHCVTGNPSVYIQIGHGCATGSTTARVLRVANITKHHAFKKRISSRGGNDVALLKLFVKLRFNRHFMPICLTNGTDHELLHPNNLVVSGWGRVNDGNVVIMNDCLHQASLNTVSDEVCQKFYPNAFMSKIMCAGGVNNVCRGDSGGPLMTRRSGGRVVQVGISSFSRKDCGVYSKTPAAFERLSAHVKWIKEHADPKDGLCFV